MERSSTADEAISVIAKLTESYCESGDNAAKQCYLVCDPHAAWLVNVCGNVWAAEQIANETVRRISTVGFSITTKIDKSSENLSEKCNGDLNFAVAFGAGGAGESVAEWDAAEKPESADATFDVTKMFSTLRSAAATSSSSSNATSSHVSHLSGDHVSCHWFTATPNPCESVFKPFVFTNNARISQLTKSGGGDDEGTLLHKLHGQRQWALVGDLLQSLEASCVTEVNNLLAAHQVAPTELDELLKDCVEAEVKFYR